MTEQRSTGAHRLLLALWLVTLAALPVAGQRVTRYDDLTAALAAHQVERVVVQGALPPGASGTSTVAILWRKGPLHRVTEVRQVVRGEGTTVETSTGNQETVTGDVTGALRHVDPSLEVAIGGPTSSHGSLLGWRVPIWLGLLPLVLGLAALVLLFCGDEPPLATRWGWAWWFLSPAAVVAMVLWLVLVARDRRGTDPGPRRRLTGGWSFLLCLLFGGSVAAAFGPG